MTRVRQGHRLIGCTRPSEFLRLSPRPEPRESWDKRMLGAGPDSTSEGDEDDVDDEQQDDEGFEEEESTRFELGLRHFVDFAEVLHFLFDDLPPRVELELPDAGPIDLPQEPISPQLGNVVDLERRLCEVHSNFGEFLDRFVSAPEERTAGEKVLEVVVRLVDDLVQEGIVRSQLKQLKIREFEDGQRIFVRRTWLDDEGRVPFEDDQVVLIVREPIPPRVFDLLVADRLGSRVVREEAGDLPPPGRGEFADRRFADRDAVDRVGLRIDFRLVRVVEERDQVFDDPLGEAAAIFVQVLLASCVLDPQAREGSQVAEADRLEGDSDDDGEGADPIQLHRDRGGERSEVRRKTPFIQEDEQRLRESGIPRRGPFGREASRQERHVDRLLDLVQVHRRTYVEESVEDDLALHAAAQAGDET